MNVIVYAKDWDGAMKVWHFPCTERDRDWFLSLFCGSSARSVLFVG